MDGMDPRYVREELHLDDVEPPHREENDARFDGFDPEPPWGDEAAPPSPLKRLGAFLREYTPLDYALEPIIRTGSLYTLTAPTGTGKTAWLISVALAIATGDRRILGMDVEQGRVVLATFENPDDVRMRLMTAAYFWAIDVAAIDEKLIIIDARLKPEEVHAALESEARHGGFRLVLIDTLAAFFDGDNLNDNVQGGGFMRRLRPLTRLAGLPAVVVAAHPVKSVTAENVVPYGGGAILNEVDGNLTLWRRPNGPPGIVDLHWQGKLRGLDFAPIPWRFELTTSPAVLDAKGREVTLPVMMPVVLDDSDMEAKAKAERAVILALLRVMISEPGGSQRTWAAAIGRAQSVVNSKIKRLQSDKLVEDIAGQMRVTVKGRKEAESPF